MLEEPAAANRISASFSRSSELPPRDPEDRKVAGGDEAAIREKMLDKTLADSYPASDPPSSLPDPSVDSLSISGETEWPSHEAA